MDYYKAKDIRKQGLISLMAERLSSGVGTGSAIGGSISDKTKATFTGIKQRFDPLNIARVVTGGSKFAPALLGALTGRSKRDIGFFTGKKKREFANLKNSPIQNSSQFAQYLGQIYNLLMKIENDRKLELDERQRQKEESDSEENRRTQALIEALTARKKPKVTRKLTKKLLMDKELMPRGFNVMGTFFNKNEQTVLTEADVVFNTQQNVNGLVWNPTNTNPEQIKILEDGVYKLFFLATTNAPAQFTFYVNNNPMTVSTAGSSRGAGQITLRALLELNQNDIIDYRILPNIRKKELKLFIQEKKITNNIQDIPDHLLTGQHKRDRQ